MPCLAPGFAGARGPKSGVNFDGGRGGLAQAAEAQFNAASYRIQQLIQRGQIPDANIQLPLLWTDFDDWCDQNLRQPTVLVGSDEVPHSVEHRLRAIFLFFL